MKVTAINLDPDLYIEENRLIPCALTTRFVSDVAGRISCVFTEDVWSANHHTKLLEQGTKAFGRYQTGTLNHGQGRPVLDRTRGVVTFELAQHHIPALTVHIRANALQCHQRRVTDSLFDG